MSRHLATLALLVPALGPLASHRLPVWLNLALLLIIGGLTPLRRPQLGVVPQALLHLIFGVTFFLVMTNAQSTPLSHHLSGLLNSLFLASAGLRYFWGWRRGDLAATLIMGLLALMSLARNMGVMPFTLLVELYIALSIWALLRADPSWAGFRRHYRAPLLLIGLAILLSFPVSSGLLRVEAFVRYRVEPYIYKMNRHVSGFGGAVNLNGLEEIESSDAIALTISAPVERLRGRVFERYNAGHWRGRAKATEPVERGHLIKLRAGAAKRALTISLKRPQRYLPLPPDAVEINLPQRGARRTLADEIAFERERTMSYQVGIARGASPLAPSPPSEEEAALPSKIEGEVRRLAVAWTAGIEGDRARVEALRARLARDYSYALSFKRAPMHRDPILHFLQSRKTGHCEFFASGLALLARGLGLRARLVTGYLVREQLNGEAVVRAQDAHAWTEVFVDGAWRTYDATPPGALPERAPQRLSATLNEIKRRLSVALDILMNLGVWELLGLGGGLILLVLLWQRVRGPKARVARVDVEAGFEPLEALEGLMRRRGLSRPKPQSLARYAARLRRAEEAEAAALVEACAALRYGREGDEATLRAGVEALLRGAEMGVGEKNSPRP
ncbi:transglutaminase-like domain-containing protein [Myxococcota bacterium]|nr:transglutaminase-like domain-containing protein [Myxococcota bacterium]MBU1899747.1 transglutaminase-like domain-containing protein [Myxococcota bacterium]